MHLAALAARWWNDGAGDGTQDMKEVIEIHFDEEDGHLRLDCGSEEFSHLRELVVSEPQVSERVGPYAEGIRSIVVRRLSAVRDTMPRRVGRGAQILVIGLALALAAVIEIVGIVVVVQWLWTRAS